MKQTQFQSIPVGAIFHSNGSDYIKKSTRTADLINPPHLATRGWYFKKREPVIWTWIA